MGRVSTMITRRRASVFLLGVLLGLTISLMSVLALGQEPLYTSQASAFPLPFPTAAQTLAVVGDFSLVASGLPDVEVYLPYEIPSLAALDVLTRLAAGLGVSVCRLESGVILAGPDLVCATSSVVNGPIAGVDDTLGAAVEAPAEDVGPDLPARYAIRLYVVEVNDERATELGVDWRRLFNTANLVRGQLDIMLAGMIGSPDLDNVVTFFEREGLARRLEDLTLFAIAGEPVQFNRGGSINTTVGAGEQVVQSSYQIGLTADLVLEPHPEGVLLAYQIADTAPSNISDPSNIQLSSTSNGLRVVVACGGAAVLVALASERHAGSGEGAPVASAIPGLGYAFGSGRDSLSRSSIVVSAQVECL